MNQDRQVLFFYKVFPFFVYLKWWLLIHISCKYQNTLVQIILRKIYFRNIIKEDFPTVDLYIILIGHILLCMPHKWDPTLETLPYHENRCILTLYHKTDKWRSQKTPLKGDKFSLHISNLHCTIKKGIKMGCLC